MSINIMRLFEGAEIKAARQTTDDLKRLVELAKRAERASEGKLRESICQAKDEPNRLPIAGALGWRGQSDD